MTVVDDLLAGPVTEGVPYRALGDVGRIVRGKRFVKDDIVESGIPCMHYGEIYTRYGVFASESFSFVSEARAVGLRFAEPGAVIIASAGETVEDIGKAVAWLGEQPIAIHDACYAFSSPLDPKFVSYFFASRHFRDQIRSQISSSKISSISTQNVARARIPVPPLDVQREIVQILDQFTQLEVELEADLEAELQARRTQYVSYRNQLFSFGGDIQPTRLGDLLREPLANGRSVPDGDGYPVLRLTALRGSTIDTSERKLGAWLADAGRRFGIQAGDLLVARGNGSKNLIARASMVEEDEDVAFPDTMVRIRPNLAKVSQRYLYYAWESAAVRAAIERRAKASSGLWKVSHDDLESITIPVPPISVQESIVGRLDTFDALANDLSNGLNAELAARRKQYEYYRDKLLTFKEAPA